MSESFWKRKAKALPAPLRERHAGYFEQAETFERAVDALIEAVRKIGVRARFLATARRSSR